MANVISRLFVEFAADTKKFSAGLQAAQRETREFAKAVKPVTKLLDDLGAAGIKAGKALTVGLTAPLVAVAGLGIQFNAMKEQAQIAFTTMLGSGEKAKVFLKGLQDFAAKTPFEFPDLVRASQRLMAMGFAADRVRSILETVGDAAAGMGRGSDAIDSITKALGDMQAKGKVSTQELNQLSEAGINAGKILADSMGKGRAEFQALVEKGIIPADQAIRVLLDGMNSQFGGMMAKQSATFSGLVSTIKDESRFLAGELTEGLFNVIKGPLEAAVKSLHRFRDAMKGWSDETKAGVLGVGLFAAALGPVVLTLGVAASSVSKLILLYGQLGGATAILASLSGVLATAMNAIPLVLVATAVASVVALFVKLRETWINNAEALRNVNDAQSRQFLLVERSISNLKELGITVDRTGKSQAELEEYVRKVTYAYRQAHPVITASSDAHKVNKIELELGTEAAKKWQTALEGARESLEQNTIADRAFAAALREVYDRGQFTLQLFDSIKGRLDGMKGSLEPFIVSLQRLAAQEELLGRNGDRERDLFNKTNRDWLRESAEAATEISKKYAQAIIDYLELARKTSKDFAKDGVEALENQAENGLKILTDSYENQAAIRRAQLEYSLSDHRKNSESIQRIWEQATANITSDFVNAFSNVIFHGKSFMKSMTDIAKTTAEGMFKAFLTGMFSPLTSAISKLGGKFASTLLGSIGGKGGSGILGNIFGAGAGAGAAAGIGAIGAGGIAAGGATASIIGVTSTAAPGAGLGASMAAFATNPITIAVAAAIAAGLAIKHFVGQGRRAADEFVQGAQNPFGSSLSSIVDAFDAAKAAGTLTLEQAKASRDALTALWSDFLSASNEFASQGETQNKVVQQAFKSLGEYFGPNLTNVFSKMDGTISALQAAATAGAAGATPGTVGSGIPQTGLATSASQIFAVAVAKFDETVSRMNTTAVPPITIDAPMNLTFYGVPESLQKEIRDQIEPTLLEDLRNNTRGIMEALLEAIRKAQQGVVTGGAPA